jgi:hypothetical protein
MSEIRTTDFTFCEAFAEAERIAKAFSVANSKTFTRPSAPSQALNDKFTDPTDRAPHQPRFAFTPTLATL